LLEIKRKEDFFLIKSDKTTRVSNKEIIKRALFEFCKVSKCKIKSSNIFPIRDDFFEYSTEYIKDFQCFMDKTFFSDRPWIEVGFGSGRNLLYLSKKFPEKRFVGIEIHKPSIEQLAKQLFLQNIKNVDIVDIDSRLFFEILPAESIEKIMVHFPIPWDKSPNRRVINKSFLEESFRILSKDGILEIKTDSKNFLEYLFNVFDEFENINYCVAKNLDSEIKSKYEDRWRKMGKDIFTIWIEKQNCFRTKRKMENINFSKRYSISNIDFKPKIFKDFFIRFEKVYKIDNDTFLIKVVFGDFDKPERKYLFLKDGKMRYFPNKPALNLSAHKKIEELLNGK